MGRLCLGKLGGVSVFRWLAFDKNPEQRKRAIENKLNAINNQLEVSAYQGAINKLLNDIQAKMDGEEKDWIVDPDAQEKLCTMIDTLLAHLEAKL